MSVTWGFHVRVIRHATSMTQNVIVTPHVLNRGRADVTADVTARGAADAIRDAIRDTMRDVIRIHVDVKEHATRRAMDIVGATVRVTWPATATTRVTVTVHVTVITAIVIIHVISTTPVVRHAISIFADVTLDVIKTFKEDVNLTS